MLLVGLTYYITHDLASTYSNSLPCALTRIKSKKEQTCKLSTPLVTVVIIVSTSVYYKPTHTYAYKSTYSRSIYSKPTHISPSTVILTASLSLYKVKLTAGNSRRLRAYSNIKFTVTYALNP
ncbi:hypothetical protein K504DRAFT_452054 [Pleomassaria siparia CBS 279.74]|uniref:Uncharacterized protein n=1 Tax=Pleomassaria siparia CBS 279.74 TaxID=1314801 RepID=A0A6G1JR42_9PLEO|nr:hypothetical protein K504DRAFT_452054 [Pleomassaria siparia CBS 279.74]